MFAFFSPSRVLPLAAAHLPLSSSALLAPFSSSLRRLYKFLFKRLLGQLVSPADVDLASLDVHLSSGDVHLRSLHLHPALLTASSASLPLTLTSATIEHVHAHLPWTQLLTQPCTLHLRGLKVTLTPRTRRGAGEEEDGGGEGDGQGLASSVLGALSESLQSLDPGDLREHLLMQQQLTESLTRESRHAQVVDEREKRTAERERGRKTAVGQEAEQRQPLLGSSDAERSSADRSGGTAAAAGGEIGVSGSSASPLFPPDVDLASAGLQVVASFLERLVSTTELSMEDVTITIECAHPVEEERMLHLSLHVNSLTYSDLSQPLGAESPASTSTSSTSSSVLGPAFLYRKRVSVHGFRVTLSEPLRDLTGAEDDRGGHELTIAHADVDQHCEVRLNIDIKGGGGGGQVAQTDHHTTAAPPTAGADKAEASLTPGTVDASIHLRAVRGLVAPHQVELLRAVAEAVGESSRIAARQVEKQRQREQSEQRRAAVKAAKASPSTHRRARRSGEGSDGRPSPVHPASGASPSAAASPDLGLQGPPPSEPLLLSASAAGAALPSLRLWAVELSVSYASLTVLEEDEEVPSQWWLQPVVIPAFSLPLPSTLLSPLISNISVDHLLLSVRHAHLQLTQTSTHSTCAFTLGRLSVSEYLQQYRLMVATVPTLRPPSSPSPPSPPSLHSPSEPTPHLLDYEEQQQRLGFSARRLLTLGDGVEGKGQDDEDDAASRGEGGSCSSPHLHGEVETAVVGLLPLVPTASHSVALPTAVASTPVASRVFVHLAPAEVDVDLGVMARLDALIAALTSQHRNGDATSAPSPSIAGDAAAAVTAAPPSPSSTFLLSAPRVCVRVQFPADTPSQSGVSTPLMADGVPGCFDSRGKVRGERLEAELGSTHIWQVNAQQQSHSQLQHIQAPSPSPSPTQSPLHDEGAAESFRWAVQFASARVDLLYPKEEAQMTEAMRQQRGSNGRQRSQPSMLSSVVDPSAYHRQRILTTDYAATASEAVSPSHANHPTCPPSLVTILLRPSHGLSHLYPLPSSTSSAPPVDRSAADAAFLDSLPDHRWFESQHSTHQHPSSRTSSASPSSSPFSSTSSPSPSPLSPPVSAAPSALAFEESASSASSIVVHAHLSACSLHLSKIELDLLTLLYTIADEVASATASTSSNSDPAAAQASHPPPPLPAFPAPSHVSAVGEEAKLSSPDRGARRASAALAVRASVPFSSVAVGAAAAASPSSIAFSSPATALRPPSPSSPSSMSDESDGSDASDMFHSVVGAESVFLQPLTEDGSARYGIDSIDADPTVHTAGHTAGREDMGIEVFPLSDLDSEVDEDELSSGSEDEEAKEEADDVAVTSSSLLSRSVVMGRSQELRRVDGRRVTGRSVASLLSSSMFHSFLSAPPALRSSTVLPSVSLFVPKPAQPYKFIRTPRMQTAAPADAQQPQPTSGHHRHWLSFSLSIRRGGVCIHEEPVPPPLYSALQPSRVVPPSSPLPPHSFYLDVGGLEVFAVARYGGEQVSYVSVRAADATLREYEQVIAQHQRWSVQSRPILFKTMTDQRAAAQPQQQQQQQQPHQAHYPLPPPDSNAAAAWSNPVLVGSFIVRCSDALHLRETTAVLNLRALTLAFEPQSAWLAKLSDLFTLTALPYVQTVGEAVKLSKDCRSLAARPLLSLTSAPQPPPPLSELVHLHFHSYDCAFDYNPPQVEGRATLIIDHFHLHTTIYPHTTEADMDIEVRDASLFLLPRSSKARSLPTASLCEVPSPHLHRLPAFSLSDYLEDVGFARVATADYVDVAVHLQDKAERDQSAAATVIEVTNGALHLLTCSDSLALALTLAQQLASPPQQPPSPQPHHWPAHSQTQSRRPLAPHNHVAAQPPFTRASEERSSVFDHLIVCDEEEDVEDDGPEREEKQKEREEQMENSEEERQLKEEERKMLPAAAAAPSLRGAAPALPSSTPPLSGGDAGVTGGGGTSLSLALQAAAEREIERVRRERELSRSIVELRRVERGREERAKVDRPALVASDASINERERAPQESDPRARWYSRFELDEREVQEAVEAARGRGRSMDDEKEQRRWRREEQAWDERIERDVQHRRDRQRRGGGRLSHRYQPQQPRVVENHMPAPRSSADEVKQDKGRMGTGRRALKRLQLMGEEEEEGAGGREGGAEAPQPITQAADVELLLYDVTVTWKIFDGLDWATEPPSPHHSHPPHPPSSAAAGEAGVGGGSDGAVGAGAVGRVDVWRFPVDDVRLPLSTLTIDESYVAAPAPAQPQPSTLSPFHFSSSPRALFVTPPIGRGYRHTDRVMELRVSGLAACVRWFPSSAPSLSHPLFSLSVDLSSVEVLDCVATSHFRKFLGPDPRVLPRSEQRSGRHGLVRLEAKQFEADEWEVDVNVKPIRLNVDQDAAELLLAVLSRATQQLPSPPAPERVDEQAQSAAVRCALVRLFRVSYPVHVCVDYRPRRLSLSALGGGDYAQLVHLFPVEHLRLSLIPVTVRDAAVEAAMSAVLNQWVDDLSHHQLHRYLSSIQPLRSLVNVGHGVVDCVVLPLEQLRNPRGRVVRGVRRGVGSLMRRVTVEGLNLLLSIAGGAQSLLKEVERAVDATNSGSAGARLSPAALASSVAAGGVGGAEASPKTLSEGLQRAYISLSRALQVASHQLVAVPSDEWRAVGGGVGEAGEGRRLNRDGGRTRGGGLGVGGAPLPPPSRSVVRTMPSVVLGPIIGLTDGLRKAMMAVQNVVQPSIGQERDERLKRPSE